MKLFLKGSSNLKDQLSKIDIRKIFFYRFSKFAYFFRVYTIVSFNILQLCSQETQQITVFFFILQLALNATTGSDFHRKQIYVCANGISASQSGGVSLPLSFSRLEKFSLHKFNIRWASVTLLALQEFAPVLKPSISCHISSQNFRALQVGQLLKVLHTYAFRPLSFFVRRPRT